MAATMNRPKSCTLEDFMKNNKEVPDAVTQEARGIIAKSRRELEDLDAEIKHLEDQLTQLRIKRAQFQENIARYDCVLSPIRRVPADILRSIFHYCLHTQRNPIMSSKEAPLLLTLICRGWRYTAYASPSLWARLYTTFSDENIIPNSAIPSDRLLKQHVTEILRLRCNAVEEWLSRSGTCPLSISICYTGSNWNGIPFPEYYPGTSDITLRLLHILARCSNRWHKLELKMPVEVYLKLESMITVSQLPMLNSLRATLGLNRQANGYDISTITLLQAQSLTKISLFSQTPSWAISNSSTNPNWAKFTDLSCHWPLSITETIFLLRNCPNLEYFTVSLTTIVNQNPRSVIIQGLISLPYLRALWIVDIIHSNFATNIYECIDAPRLKWIGYTYKSSGRSQAPMPITTLLSKSTELKKLTIEVNLFTTTALRWVLQSAGGITHLVLGPELSRDNNLSARSFNISSNVNWNFGDLFLDGEGDGVGSGPASSLLPHLEVLEISSFASNHISDETLLAFILSRMNPSSPSKRSILKSVSVIFCREKEMDIAKDVYAHAERIGTEIELDFDYPDEPPTRWLDYCTTPKYGLGMVDRSWEHIDIQEEMSFLPY